jgi:hypothetical protein
VRDPHHPHLGEVGHSGHAARTAHDRDTDWEGGWAWGLAVVGEVGLVTAGMRLAQHTDRSHTPSAPIRHRLTVVYTLIVTRGMPHAVLYVDRDKLRGACHMQYCTLIAISSTATSASAAMRHSQMIDSKI